MLSIFLNIKVFMYLIIYLFLGQKISSGQFYLETNIVQIFDNFCPQISKTFIAQTGMYLLTIVLSLEHLAIVNTDYNILFDNICSIFHNQTSVYNIYDSVIFIHLMKNIFSYISYFFLYLKLVMCSKNLFLLFVYTVISISLILMYRGH